MKAILKPLNGKYYGTEIQINFEDGGDTETFKLWDSGDYEPSVRELESMGYTQQQWDNNELVSEGYSDEKGNPYMVPIRSAGLICDSHFESKLTYQRALKLLNLINNSGTSPSIA